MTELDENFLQRLGKSYELVGAISPVTLDPSGRIIDGFHRLAIDPMWPKLIISWLAEREEEGLRSYQYLFKCPSCGDLHEVMELVRRPRNWGKFDR